MIYSMNKLENLFFTTTGSLIVILSIVSCSMDTSNAYDKSNILNNTRQYLVVKFEGDNHYTMLNSKGDPIYDIPKGQKESSVPSQVLDNYFWFENNRYDAATGNKTSIPEDYSVYIYGKTMCKKINADTHEVERYTLVNRDKQEFCVNHNVDCYDPFYIYCSNVIIGKNLLYSSDGDSLLAYEVGRYSHLYQPSDEGLWCLYLSQEESHKPIFAYYTSDGQEKYKITPTLNNFTYFKCPMIDGQVVIDGSIYDKDGNIIYKQPAQDSLKANYPIGDGLFISSKTKGIYVWFGIMDCDGHEIIPCRYARFVSNSGGKIDITPSFKFNIMRLGDYFVFMNDSGKWVLVDKNGQEKQMQKSIVEIAQLDKKGIGTDIFGPVSYTKINGDTPSCVLEGEFKSYDLRSFALKGQVKTCVDMTSDLAFDKWGRIIKLGEGNKINYDGISVTYGEIISYDNVTEKFGHMEMPLRRKSGKNPNMYNCEIDEINFSGMEGYKYEYNKNGFISKYNHWTGDLVETVIIEYDERGFPLIEKCVQNSFEGNFTLLTKYTYKDIDSHGNWISRSVSIEDLNDGTTGTHEEKRTITYFD